MGKLIDGKWVLEDVNPETKSGEYIRQDQKFRDVIDLKGPYPPEGDRYHLYVSYACPWAHRTLIVRELKNLKDLVSVSVVSPNMLDRGWTFEKDFPGTTGDPLFSSNYLSEVYIQADPQFSGKVTVPVLFDKKSKKIVNNESSEIIRIFNSAFDEITGNREDYYPEDLRSDIDRVNSRVYESVNNGVYKCGFARKQEAYDRNFKLLFSTLDFLDQELEGKDHLVANQLTEADIRLFTTLVRFDSVYYGHFKCNQQMIRDYKNLSRYLKDLYALPAFRETTNFDHIKRHYYFSHKNLNPYQIVPMGPKDEI